MFPLFPSVLGVANEVSRATEKLPAKYTNWYSFIRSTWYWENLHRWRSGTRMRAQIHFSKGNCVDTLSQLDKSKSKCSITSMYSKIAIFSFTRLDTGTRTSLQIRWRVGEGCPRHIRSCPRRSTLSLIFRRVRLFGASSRQRFHRRHGSRRQSTSHATRRRRRTSRHRCLSRHLQTRSRRSSSVTSWQTRQETLLSLAQ